jgi:8-oxo-dGTP pyrophosphatase MutT (NUDIX family)
MIVQYGVVPWRLNAGGRVEILLITSRETRRWVVPRGNPMRGKAPHEAAAQEAYEEAGITGRIGEEPLGAYCYDKRRRDGSLVPARVRMFPMEVVEEAEDWPERNERERRWFEPDAAAMAVLEADLGALILVAARGIAR